MADEDQVLQEEITEGGSGGVGDPHCGDDCLDPKHCGDSIGALGDLSGYCDHDNAENQAKEKAIDDFIAAEAASEVELPDWINHGAESASNKGFGKLHSKIAEWAPGIVSV